MKTYIISAVIMLAAPIACVAGPFGLDMGMKLSDIPKAKPTEDSMIFTIPTEHPDFPIARLLISPTHGLAKMICMTEEISVNDFGDQLKTQFSKTENSLKKKYGDPKHFDFVQAGSLWTEPREWMVGLVKEERILFSGWDKSDLPDHIENISLKAVGLTTSKGLIILSYEFKNFKEVVAEMKKKQDDSL